MTGQDLSPCVPPPPRDPDSPILLLDGTADCIIDHATAADRLRPSRWIGRIHWRHAGQAIVLAILLFLVWTNVQYRERIVALNEQLVGAAQLPPLTSWTITSEADIDMQNMDAVRFAALPMVATAAVCR